jgi:carbohydrate kinase (thermoresistant glucokinase family)
MGVSGCGKSTLARALADRLTLPFVEGDALHPPENIAKMAAGIPLDDADRQPFLEAVGDALQAADPGAVAACSALKHRYRDLLRDRAGPLRFVLPDMDRAMLAARMTARQDHFMPAALLDSQLATLELPSPDEQAICIDGSLPTAAQVDAVLAALKDTTT